MTQMPIHMNVLIVDEHPMHKAKLVQRLVEPSHDAIELFFLPPRRIDRVPMTQDGEICGIEHGELAGLVQCQRVARQSGEHDLCKFELLSTWVYLDHDFGGFCHDFQRGIKLNLTWIVGRHGGQCFEQLGLLQNLARAIGQVQVGGSRHKLGEREARVVGGRYIQIDARHKQYVFLMQRRMLRQAAIGAVEFGLGVDASRSQHGMR